MRHAAFTKAGARGRHVIDFRTQPAGYVSCMQSGHLFRGSTRMKRAVYGIVQTSEQAEVIVGKLRASGFTGNDISVLFPDKQGTRDFAHEKNTKAPEGAAAGGVTGMGVGAILGWLAGI